MTEQPPPRPDVEQLRAAIDHLAAAMRATVEHLAPAVAAIAAELSRVTATVRAAAPAAPRDRPAWQSPHGPAHTRRKEQRP